jgi:hypothetical protein
VTVGPGGRPVDPGTGGHPADPGTGGRPAVVRSTRLDDLLSFDEPPRRGRTGRRRSARTLLLGRFLVGMVPATVLWELLRHNAVGIPYLLVAVVVAVLACLRALLDRLGEEELPATLRDTPPRVAPHISPSDGIRTAAGRWEMRLEWTYDDLPRFASVVQQAVAEMVAERLRLRHSVSLRDDPQRARELVGPQLWAFINEPVSRPMRPPELAALVTRMEQL